MKHTDEANNSVPEKRPSLAEILREQTMKNGVGGSKTIGLLTTVIGGQIPDETTNKLDCMKLKEMSQMTVEELCLVPGISRQKALKLAAVFEIARRLAAEIPAPAPLVKCPADVAGLLMEEMRYLDREHLKLLILNSKDRVISAETVAVGTLSANQIHPREIFRSAVKKSAASIILVHNHPSGDPTPSPEDIDETEKIIEAGNIIGIEVLDHIIIGDGQYISLGSEGLI